jgi:hypothetical protein
MAGADQLRQDGADEYLLVLLLSMKPSSDAPNCASDEANNDPAIRDFNQLS